MTGHHLREDLGQGGAARVVGGGGIPLHQHLLALGRGQHGHGGEGGLGPGHERFHERAEVLRHPADGRRLEQVGVVAQRALVALRRVRQAQLQVELDGGVAHLERAQRQALALSRRRGRVLQGEDDLEERAATHVARGLQHLHQSLEGHVLVGIGAQRGLLHLPQQVDEGGRGVHVGAQHQRIDEEADEAFQLSTLTAGNRRADGDVLLPRVAGQQHLEGGKQRHEGRGALLLAERLELLGGSERERDGHLRAVERLHGRAGLVGGQLQGGEAGEVLLPVAELLVQHFALQPLALPGGVVGVLDGQRRQGRGPALGEGLVEGGDFTHQHAHGPTVRDDVVHVEGEHVLGGAQLQQLRAHQRSGGEVEGAQGLLAQPSLQLGAGGLGLQVAEVHQFQRQLPVRRDELEGLALLLGEGGAQGFVAVHQLIEAALQGRHVEQAVHAHEGGHVVGGTVGFELVDEPQPLLREGQGQCARAGHGDDGGRQVPRSGLPCGIDTRCERLERRRLEEDAQGQLHAEGGAQARDELGREQRVSTQLEEVVGYAHARHAQHLGEDSGQQLLGGCPRGDVGRVRSGRHRLRRGQRLAVHLGVRSQREGVQSHQRGGHHVLGQPLLQVSAQRGDVE